MIQQDAMRHKVQFAAMKQAKESAECKQEMLQIEWNKMKKLSAFLLNKQGKQKMEEKERTMKQDLLFLADKMNEFNVKYDQNKLSMIHNDNADLLMVEQDIGI